MENNLGIPITELKRANVETGEIEGYGAYFGNVDHDNDTFAPGAFRPALAEHKAKKTAPAFLFNHDMGKVVGIWTEFREDFKGLWMKGKITLGTRLGREVFELIKSGALGLSVGFRIAPGGTRSNGSTRTITKVATLFETSAVAIPSNSEARILRVKSLRPATPRELERTLMASAGLSRNEAKRLSSGGWSALTREGCNSKMDQVLEKLDTIITQRGET